MKRFTTILLVFFCLFSLYTKAGHTKKSTPTGGYYWEFLPDAYAHTTRTYPTILFLHGCGKIAYRTNCQSSTVYIADPMTELERVLEEGLPKEIDEGSTMAFTFEVNGHMHTDTFIVISPQLNGQNATSWTSKNIETWVKYTLNNYRVDRTRFYITGLSLGGRGAYDYAKSTNPVRYFADSLAAIVPVAANPSSQSNPCLIAQRNIPVKSYHGTNDGTFTYSGDVNFQNAINNCAPPPDTAAVIVPITGAGHTAIVWNTAYETSAPPATNMYHWLLRQKRGGYTNVLPVVNAGTDTTLQLPDNQLTITGSAYDTDGTIAVMSWTQISGQAATYSSNLGVLTVTGLTAGTYIFRFSATDNEGETSSDEITITVNNAYTPGSWLEITANSAAGKSIALYFDGQKSNAVQQSVRAGGNDYLTFYVQQLTGTPNWNSLKVELMVAYQTKSLAIGSYVSTTIQNGWQRVEIPLSAFAHDAGRWTSGGVSLVTFKAASGLGNVVFGVDEIGFTGGSTPFVWYGDVYETSGSAAAVTESSPQFIISNRATSGGYTVSAARQSIASLASRNTVFPNPANEKIDAGRTDVIQMELWRTDGVIIRTVKDQHILYIEDVAPGVYLLRYTLANGERVTERIVINH